MLHKKTRFEIDRPLEFEKLRINSDLTKGSIKDIHWTVVTVIFHILHIIFHLHADRVAIIVLATLKLLVTILASKSLIIT